jgi:predicted transcriptional regulator
MMQRIMRGRSNSTLACSLPTKNIENNPMQSSMVVAGMDALSESCENILTRRANQRHYSIIAQHAMHAVMTAKLLKDILERAEKWPEEAQTELAQIALEIDAGLMTGKYRATPAELAGIDRGLEAAREGRFATDDQVDRIFKKHRPA